MSVFCLFTRDGEGRDALHASVIQGEQPLSSVQSH
jgi:hypothetical protein